VEGLEAGDTVLIHAGASGLASAAIPLAKTFGARVLTKVRSEEDTEAIHPLGADIVINCRKQDVGAVLDRRLEEGCPVELVMDWIGGADLGIHLSKMAKGGRWILIATLGGELTQISLRPLLTRGIRLIGSTLRSRSLEMKGRILRELTRLVWPKFEAGVIRPGIYRVLPIDRAEEAHGILERGENIGKVVLTVNR
jgi:NADPH:quinone reductase